MDPYYHHRYVQRPPNFFHHLPPPPPPHRPLPPPPPYLHRPLPPPTPPPHHLSQFSFAPETPQFFDYPPSPPRVSSIIVQPPNNIPRYPSPPPRSPPRFIERDYIDSSNNNNQEPVWGRRDVEFDLDEDERYRLQRRRMDIDDVREFRSSSGNYVDRYEGERWEYGDVEEGEISVGSSSRRDHHSYDYGDVRFSNSRSRVENEDLRRSPQKKKSALHRIHCGKANNRSRNQENDGSGNDNGRVRGKQKDVFERLEKKVERSPMELNVSFKSNALVAKAIMTPSSPGADSDRCETHRSKKIRKVNTVSGSPVKKVGDDLGKGESSASESGHRSSSNKEPKSLADKIAVSAAGSSSNNSTLDSNKGSKHLADKITDSAVGHASAGTLNSDKESKLSPEKVKFPVVRSTVVRCASNDTSFPSSNGTNDLIGTGESKGFPEIMVLDQDSNQVGKDGTPKRKIRKKKKKVTAPNRNGVGPGNVINTLKKATLVPQQDEDVVQVAERTTSDQMITLEDVNMKLPSDELVCKLEKPSEMTIGESIKQSNSDWERASPAKAISSGNMDSEINDLAYCTSRSVLSDPSMSNSTCMNGVQNVPTSFAEKNVGGHPEDELRVSEDGLIKGSSEAMICEVGNGDVVLSSLRGSKVTTSIDADNAGGISQDELRVSEGGLTKECSEAMICVGGNGDVVLSSLGGSKVTTSFDADNFGGISQDELRVSEDGFSKECSEAMICVGGNGDVVLSSLEGSKVTTSFDADNVGRLSQDELRVSEDGLTKESSEAMVCVGGNGGVVLSSLEGSKVTTSFSADNVGGLSQDELRVSEDGLTKESSEVMVCVGENCDVDLSSLDGSKILEVDASSAALDKYNSSVSDLGFSDGKKSAVAVIGSLEAGSMEPSSDLKIVPLLTNIEKGLQESFPDGNDSSYTSSEAGRVAVMDDLLSAELLGNSDPGAGTFGDSIKRSCVDGVTLSPEMRHTKKCENAVVSAVDDITIVVDDDCLLKVTRERKTKDAQPALTAAKTSEAEENVFSSLLVLGKNPSYLREHSSREEEITVPCDGNDSPKGDCSHEGPSEVELSHQDCFNSCSPKIHKKRKVSSPRVVKPVSCATTTDEGPSSMPIIVPSIKDVHVTELESQKTLSNADDGLPSHPSVILHESRTAKDVCQAASFEDDSMDHFSDVQQQVIACNSQLGAAGETTTSGISIGMLGMAYGVSEDKGSSLGVDQKLAPEDCRFHNYVLGKEDMPLLANNLPLFADSNCVPTMEASVEGVESVPKVSSLVPSPEDLPNNSVLREPAKSSISGEIVIEKDPNVAENSITAIDPISCLVKMSSATSQFGSDLKVGGIPPVNVDAVSLSSHKTVKSIQNVSSLSWKPTVSANQQSRAGPMVFSGRPSASFITSRNVPISKKPLTWCRTGSSSSSVNGRESQKNPLPPQSHPPKDFGKASSYIRKGNSLVRKPSPVGSLSQAYHAPSPSVYRFNSSGVNNLNRISENRTGITVSPSCKGTPVVTVPSERPKTPPQSKSFGCTTKSTSLPVVDHPGNGSIATNSDILEVTDSMLALKPAEHASVSSALSEYQSGLRGNSESENTLDEGSSGKKIVYVKQRSNQLVAASDKPHTSSDGYYKRRKNQLIRASSTNHTKQRVGAAENTIPIQRGLARTSKRSKFSLVWKLGDAQSSRKYGSTVGYEKLWPYLFPWKRSSYRRSLLSSSPSDSSPSIIRRKLMLAKKRETIYTRSIHGLSLRRSKVISMSGSSLKWSKSIEQTSKKAIEEAARAVAADNKRKRGRDGSSADSMNENTVSRKSYSVNLLPGERIFRIGSERYKMDPSGKTLQRISEEEPSVPVPETKKSYIPKRLLIGNDEYVRVGNGNKLVRNPKRRVRILASEKVRWSLHTARSRLARKKQYCQFFTRFGKCNKDNGKCLYIHDASKIAVCSKFLNGSCSDTNCKLTHKVIPERMQDCSYFLQGICSNENCPYRHVNVNPNASICEGFRRGYCADGNECRKKHTYVCPVFEATGRCTQGSKCKLHHPKNKRKGVKRKASSEMMNVRGRYFGSPHIDITERIAAGSEKPSVNSNGDIFFKEGKFVDFISLDGSDEEGQAIDQRSEETPTCESGSTEIRLDDLDELIKPMRLLNRNRSVNSSPFIGSPNDMTTSYASEYSLL